MKVEAFTANVNRLFCGATDIARQSAHSFAGQILPSPPIRPGIDKRNYFFSSLHDIVGISNQDQYAGPRFATLRSRTVSIWNCTDQKWKQKINLRVI